MRVFLVSYLIILSNALLAQNATIVGPDFHFNEGIYFTFEEFKTNSPTVKDFTVRTHGSGMYLEFPCQDSLGNIQNCTAENIWGYCKDRSVYMYQGYSNSFFRLQVIGALIHFYSIESYYERDFDHRYGQPYMPTSRRVTQNEMLIEWETGQRFHFTYKNFSVYLKEKDSELYLALKNSKKKRKMIYFYLLKYNEKHLVYIQN